jgi:regulatory protein
MAMDKKIPKKVTKSYLENSALYYLQRYATSSANLRRVMMRKVNKSCRHHGEDPAKYIPLLDDMLARYAASGLLNDESYARAQTQTLRRAGKSAQAIAAKLASKGLSREDAAHALDAVDETEDAELQAAIRLARKKKLGAGDRKKELAALGRAGFSYDVAKKALDSLND